jgi:hypothetical protein
LRAITPETGGGFSISDRDGTERVVIGRIASNPDDYGIKIISSDGDTVILDGVSNVFKIAATGTLSVAFPGSAGASNESSVTLPGLTSGSQNRAVIGFLSTSTSPAAAHYSAAHWSFDATGHMQWGGALIHGISGTTDVVVTLRADAGTFNRSGDTLYARYYVLQEISI